MVEKIRRLRAMTAGRGIRIEVDGGITTETAATAVGAGADVLIAGSAIFQGTRDAYARNIAALREAAEGTQAI
jgi:ribulose-phosphate 3-epimerase